jgi:chloramphenicol 3-O phosphotransferase
MEKGKIIFLNGTTSSGKTTLARQLLEKLPEQYHYIGVDTFMRMEPEWYLEQAFNNTIDYLSNRGINTIVDYVILDTPIGKQLFSECLELLHDHPVLFVRVDCPLEELERRERARGDRNPGQARWQFEHIHGHETYDVTINTYEMTLDGCVGAILSKLAQPEQWNAFASHKTQYE